jgi:hypothetical protein
LENIRANFAKTVGIQFADSGLGGGASYIQKK